MTPHHSSSSPPHRLAPLREGRGLLLGVGLLLTLLIALLLLFPPRILQQADLRLYDHLLTGRSTAPVSGVPVLVGIDEESLAAYGQWPWPRYRLAALVERLQQRGATVVTLDFLMPEPDRTAPEVINAERQRDRGTHDAARIAADSNTAQLASVLSAGKTVLGCYFTFAGSLDVQAPPSAADPVTPDVANLVVASRLDDDTRLPHPVGAIRSVPMLTAAAGSEGFTNALHDLDGVLRRVPLLLPYVDRWYPSLALASLMAASGERKIFFSQDAAGTTLTWENRRIPLDNAGNLLLDFRDAAHPFPYLSARSVLTDGGTTDSLKGKIAIVGSWAKGLGDFHLTPSGQPMSGLVFHATVIDTILSGRYIARPSWAAGAELCSVLLLGLVSTWLISRPGYLLSLATVIIGVGGAYLGGRVLLLSGGLYISPLMPMLTPVLNLTFLGLLKYGIEARKVRQRTRDLLDAQDTVIISMSALTEARDKETGGHIYRTQRYVEILARELAKNPRYRDLDENSIELLTKSAPLHDIGKVGIPDRILQKNGKLDDEEYAIMKSHTLIGVEALTRAMGATGHPELHGFMDYARQMVESHHECWDGSGYPHGLRGEDIPLAGRLMALADVYDAMVSRRVYKQELSHDNAMKHIVDNAGKKFDPEVVAAFVARNEEFLRIARESVGDPAPEGLVIQ